jgi:NitT/TauT family transport system ATP-binding protein
VGDELDVTGVGRLETVGLTKEFPTKTGPLVVLDDVNVHAEAGEFVCLVGSSGCGKSTLLAIMAGLDWPTHGAVLLDGEPVTGAGPDRGLVFQSYSLYPWRTVAKNVAFGLELSDLSRADVRRRVDEYLGIMGLTDFAEALPHELSGGMRQRVAVARALATGPEVLLLDEPFGALDAQTRSSMQEFILKVWRETGTTIVMVTHDVEEAVFLAGRIYVLSPRPGRVAAEITVPFPSGRLRALLREREFQDLCGEIDDLLRTQPGALAGAAGGAS